MTVRISVDLSLGGRRAHRRDGDVELCANADRHFAIEAKTSGDDPLRLRATADGRVWRLTHDGWVQDRVGAAA